MKKVLFFAMGLFYTTTFAQTGKVGINTEKPRATLDIVGKPITNADKNISRGVILPHISDAQKAEFTDKTEGLMIWNTTKKCIDFWNGATWQCYGGTAASTSPASTTYSSIKTYGVATDFTRNNCSSGQRGSVVRYSTTASATRTSTVSQAEADRLATEAAQAEFNRLGQIYANANGTCSATSFSATKTYTGSVAFTRNNCPVNTTAGSVVYNATASGSATSTISQADADNKALAVAQAKYSTDGQNYANTHASCKTILERMARCTEFEWSMWPDRITIFRKNGTTQYIGIDWHNDPNAPDTKAEYAQLLENLGIYDATRIEVTSNGAIDWACNLE